MAKRGDSGAQFNFRVKDADLLEAFKRKAIANNTSATELIISFIESYVAGDVEPPKPADARLDDVEDALAAIKAELAELRGKSLAVV